MASLTEPGADPLSLFRLDPASATPPYRQLHELVVTAVRTGRLVPGQRLPTVRALAAHLGIAPGTVASGYTLLEQAGIVEGRGRAGTFVTAADDPISDAARTIARGAVESLAVLGFDADRSIELFREALRTVH